MTDNFETCLDGIVDLDDEKTYAETDPHLYNSAKTPDEMRELCHTALSKSLFYMLFHMPGFDDEQWFRVNDLCHQYITLHKSENGEFCDQFTNGPGHEREGEFSDSATMSQWKRREEAWFKTWRKLLYRIRDEVENQC